MRTRTRAALAAAATVASLGITARVVAASGGGSGDEDDGPDVAITGADLERASAAALAATGGGRVTETEVGDEESFYEVEVTFDDGRQVDVQLDESFELVSVADDGDRAVTDDSD